VLSPSPVSGEVAPSYGDGGGAARPLSPTQDHDLKIGRRFDWGTPSVADYRATSPETGEEYE